MQGKFMIIKRNAHRTDHEVQIKTLIGEVEQALLKGDAYVQISEGDRAYTKSQHNAIWKFCDMVAKTLSEKGVTLQALIESMRNGAELEVTKENVKYQMWQTMQEALFGSKSMGKLERDQVSQIYDHINRFLINSHDVSVPFPSKEMISESRD